MSNDQLTKEEVKRWMRHKRWHWLIVCYIAFLLGFAWGLASADEVINTGTLEEYFVSLNALGISPHRLKKIEKKTIPIVSTIQSFSMSKYSLSEVKYIANKYCGIIIGAERRKGKTLVYVEWQSPFVKLEKQFNEHQTQERALADNSNAKGIRS